MKSSSYTILDNEIVSIAAAWDLINSLVHFGHFDRIINLDDCTLRFKTEETQKLFLIILADFLSLPRNGTLGLTKPSLAGSKGETYLGFLQTVVDNPQFSGDCSLLNNSISTFSEWLDGKATIEKAWFPSIKKEMNISVKRIDYLRICGNISKHGFTRLDSIVAKIRKIFSDNNVIINDGESYTIIPEFQEWFADNIFIASAPRVAWHLNEIRWGIFQYLSSEFRRSYKPTHTFGGAQMYKFDVPSEISTDLFKYIYWDLMNDMRDIPSFPRFTPDKSLFNLY